MARGAGPKWAMVRREVRLVREEQGVSVRKLAAVTGLADSGVSGGTLGLGGALACLRALGVPREVAEQVAMEDVRAFVARALDEAYGSGDGEQAPSVVH